MLSLGRGKGASLRAAGAESMSHFKADTTIAFLSLFPRSRITVIREDSWHLIGYLCICVNVHLICSHAATHLTGCHWSFDQKAPDLKDLEPSDCSEILLLLASDSPAILLCLPGHFGNISGLSL